MISADLPLGGLAMCDLEREVVGTHRAVAAIGRQRVTLYFVSQFFWRAINGQRPICAGCELSACCKAIVSAASKLICCWCKPVQRAARLAQS